MDIKAFKCPCPITAISRPEKIYLFKYFLLLVLMVTSAVKTVEAKDFTINTTTFYSEKAFYLDIQNASRDALPVKRISVMFNGLMHTMDTSLFIPSGSTQRFLLPEKVPIYSGTYNLSVWITYLNDGIPLSVAGNTMFNFGDPAQINTSLTIKAEHIKRHGKITVTFQDPEYIDYAMPILPYELQVKSAKRNGNKIVYEINNLTPFFNNNYNIFWVIEKTEMANGAQQHTGTCFRGKITTSGGSSALLDWNFPSYKLLISIWIVSLLLLIILGNTYYHGETGKKPVMYFLFYFFLINLVVSVFQIPNLISGNDYDYFRDIVLPFYYAGLMGYGIFTTIQLLRAPENDKETMLSDKKIWIMFSYIESKVRSRNKKEKKKKDKNSKETAIKFEGAVKTAFLSLGVKFFFLPLLSSWAINNIFHVIDLIRDYRMNFYYINAMLIDVFILFDTMIFAFSYSIESKYLNSNIRSVEPTLVGWIVCLWCYPPFNRFSFRWIDNLIPFKSEWVLPEWALMIVLATIAFLWFIYVTATFALGSKSSNLTNRGTVSRFPYSIVRHPAYASKNLLWVLSFLFLSKASIPHGKYDILSLGQTCGFLIIYYLRAVTEERHLSRDPDYLKYKQKVRYRFFPGIW